MPRKGPLTPEQLAKRREASLRWYHENKQNFSEEQREKMREHSRRAAQKYREKNREAVNAKAAANSRKRRAEDPAFRQADVERCRAYAAAHREELNRKERERLQDPQYRAASNERRLAHHHANRDEANEKRAHNALERRVHTPWAHLLKAACGRAAKKGLEFSLTPEWAAARWTGRCEVTGIEFNLRGRTPGPKFFSPSIDQIVPKNGYTAANCRFVLWAVNSFKHDATDADMILVARAIAERNPL